MADRNTGITSSQLRDNTLLPRDMNTGEDTPIDGELLSYDAGSEEFRWVEPSTGGGLTWTVISSNTTASANNGYLIDASSGNVTLTLPASPSEGDTIGVCDYKNQANTNTITIARNGNNIEGAAADMVLDEDGIGIILVYTDVTIGWKMVTSEKAGGDKIHLEQDMQQLADGTSIDFDVSGGGYGYVTLEGNRDIDVSNPITGGTYRLRITQDATGSRTLTWSANFIFPADTEPVLSSGANDVDELEFRCFDGTTLTLTNAVFDV